MSLCTSHGFTVNSPVKRNREKPIPVNALANLLCCGYSQGADYVNTQGEGSSISIENEPQHTFPFLAFPPYRRRPLLRQQLQVKSQVFHG